MSIENKCPVCGTIRRSKTSLEVPTLREPSTHANSARGSDSTRIDPAGIFIRENSKSSGDVFGNYELIEEVAHGGMGVVYKARQVALNRTVALKMVLSERLASDADIKRFLIEAQAGAKLQHPNIVAIHEVGNVGGQHFYSMDFIAGQTLAQIVRENPLPARRAAAYVEKIARAIHYAHQEGVLHRDIKPGNVIVDSNDEPRVTDFGLAKLLQSDSQQTLAGTIMGTPSYMSLEQATGETANIDARSDVYSMGAVLYELLTGSPPYRGETTLATLKLLAETDAVRPRQINPKIPADLETVCLKALEKQPARRYPDALAFADDLRRFLQHEPITARPIGAGGKLLRWCVRKPALATVGLIATILLLAISIGSPIAAYNLNQANVFAEKRRAMAESSANRARRSAYISDMSSVQEAVERGQLSYALGILRQHIPETGTRDLRNWEWRYYSELCQAEDLATLSHHPDQAIYFCSVSPRGTWVGSESAEGTVKLWNIPRNREALSLQKEGAPGPQFSAGEKFFAVPMADGMVRLWDLGTLQEQPGIQHPGGVQAIGFSGDDQLITFAGDTIRYWDISSRDLLREVPAIAGARVIATPDWKTVVAWNAGKEIKLWREGEGLKWSRNSGHASQIREPALALSPDGKWLALGLSLGGGGAWTAEILDAATGDVITVFPAQRANATITGVSFSADGKLFTAASEDQTVRLWDTGSWTSRATLIGRLVSVAFCLPGNKQAVTAGKDGFVRLWKVEEAKGARGQLEVERKFLDQLVTARRGAFTANNALFLSLAPDGEGVVVDPLRPAVLRRFSTPIRNSTRVAVGPEATIAAIGREDGRVTLWNTDQNRSSGEVQLAESQAVTAVALSPDGKWLTARNDKGIFRFWETAGQKELPEWRDLPKQPGTLCFSPDGTFLACGQGDGTISLWEVPTARGLGRLSGHSKGIILLGFSQNGTRLASTSYDATACVWDLKARSLAARFGGATGVFFHAELSPDGTRVCLSEWQNSSLFDVQSQRYLARLITYFPRFLNQDSLFGLGQDQIWHWKPTPLAEVARPAPVSFQ
jgi:WD40 repeat protein/tRNA A-37 threonylcarbamoyl transferase component Bud32